MKRMHDFLTVSYLRGDFPESIHKVAVSVRQNSAETDSYGDSGEIYYTRSVAKIIQAYVCLKIMSQYNFRLNQQEMAIITSSHSGTEEQVQLVSQLLRRAGLSEEDLHCGLQAPAFRKRADEKVKAGIPFDKLDHNCSGKHTAMLIVSKLSGWDLSTYFLPEHPLQIEIKNTLSELSGINSNDIITGIDGCGVPNFAIALNAMSGAVAELLSRTGGNSLIESYFSALCTERNLLAGPGRFINEISKKVSGQYFIKDGAEGYLLIVHTAEQLVISAKVLDGSVRVLEPLSAYLIRKYFRSLNSEEQGSLDEIINKPLLNTRGEITGMISVL